MTEALPLLYDAHALLGRHAVAPARTADLPELLEDLARLGIGGGLVGSQTALDHDAERGNTELFDAVAGRPRWRACPTLLPRPDGQGGDPATQLQEALERDAAAFRVCPVSHDYALSSLDETFEIAAARAVPLCLDLGEIDWTGLDRLLVRHPRLTVVLSWVGYRALRRLDPLLSRHPRLHLDTVNFSSHQGLEWFVARHGSQRLLLGTGVPVREPGEGPTRLGWSALDDDAVAAVGHGNAARLFNLPAAPTTQPPAVPASRIALTGATTPSARVSTIDDRSADLARAVLSRRPAALPGIIDAHAHLGPYSLFHIPAPDAATMVEVMDRTGVSTTVIAANRAIQQDSHLGNSEALRAVDAHPGRFAAYGVVNPWQQPEDELQRIAEDDRFVGIKLHPDLHQYPLTGSRLAPVWDHAERTGCPVLTHSWHGSPFDSPSMLLEIAERWPTIRVLIGHAGAQPAGMDEAAMVTERLPGAMLETCGSFMTSPLLEQLVERCGAERVIFGSDIPFIDQRVSWGRLTFARLSPVEIEAIIRNNARRLFHWRPGRTWPDNRPDLPQEVTHVVK